MHYVDPSTVQSTEMARRPWRGRERRRGGGGDRRRGKRGRSGRRGRRRRRRRGGGRRRRSEERRVGKECCNRSNRENETGNKRIQKKREI